MAALRENLPVPCHRKQPRACSLLRNTLPISILCHFVLAYTTGGATNEAQHSQSLSGPGPRQIFGKTETVRPNMKLMKNTPTRSTLRGLLLALAVTALSSYVARAV